MLSLPWCCVLSSSRRQVLARHETGPGGDPRPPHASPSWPFLPCFHCATVALASSTFIVSRAMRPCSMAVGRQDWNFETRERRLELTRREASSHVLGAGREQVDGLADRDDARGGAIRERDEGVAGRDALAELQYEGSLEKAGAGPAAHGSPAAAGVRP